MRSKKKDDENSANSSINSLTTVKAQVDEWKTSHLVSGFSAGIIASSIFLVYSRVSEESLVMLIIFNFLFVFLIFPLKGNLLKKLFVLLLGNLVGYVWNRLFSSFASIVSSYQGQVFNTLYLILSPFLNLIWIVSYWSVSLTIFSKSGEHEKR